MGKKYDDALKLIEADKFYSPKEAVALVKKTASTKFDSTVEVAFRLGVNPKYPDQQVRGALVLPNGTGKSKTVMVFAKGPKVAEAEAAGADFVGGEEYVDKIKNGWMAFDVCIATPDMMGLVGRLGKVLGPRGLMPNPKAGTVTPDVAKAVTEAKAGKIEYRLDKTNIIHCPIGKASFGADKLEENFTTLMEAIVKAKPAATKGTYLKSCTVTSTMGPGVHVTTSKYGV